jgi:hypothetical protein
MLCACQEPGKEGVVPVSGNGSPAGKFRLATRRGLQRLREAARDGSETV